MVSVSKVRKLVNPGKRKLSPLQKLFFGSKRQRAAVRAKNAGKRSIRKTAKAAQKSAIARHTPQYGKRVARYIAKGAVRGVKHRYKKNVSSIVVIRPNPGSKRRKYKRTKGLVNYIQHDLPRGVYTRKKRNSRKVVVINKGEKMARKRHVKRNRYVSRKRRNPSRRHRNMVYRKRIRRGLYQYSSNPGRRRRSRTRNVSVRRYHRRRNPGMFAGTGGRVLGVIGGVALTKFLSGMVPASFNTGVMSYLATGVIAFAQGKLVGKIAKNESLGNDFLVGGLAFLAAKILNDFFPSIGTYVGIAGGRGMGLIGGSSFYVPQVNRNGSMGSFVVPGAVMGAIPPPATTAVSTAGMHGVGRLRRTGRLM